MPDRHPALDDKIKVDEAIETCSRARSSRRDDRDRFGHLARAQAKLQQISNARLETFISFAAAALRRHYIATVPHDMARASERAG